MNQDTYTMLIRGFDITIETGDNDSYHVTVSDGGVGWEVDIPIDFDKIEEDEEDLDGSDALMDHVGNAAVDLYEAELGTLGEGASSMDMEMGAMAMVKRAVRNLAENKSFQILISPKELGVSAEFNFPKSVDKYVETIEETIQYVMNVETSCQLTDGDTSVQVIGDWTTEAAIEAEQEINDLLKDHYIGEFWWDEDEVQDVWNQLDSPIYDIKEDEGEEIPVYAKMRQCTEGLWILTDYGLISSEQGYALIPNEQAQRTIKDRGILNEKDLNMIGMNKRKQAFFDSLQWEDWFMKLKGTAFEDSAIALLQQYFEIDLAQRDQAASDGDLRAQEVKLTYDLNMLNLERMQNTDNDMQVIVVQAQRSTRIKLSFWDSERIESYLERFVGNPLEADAIAKMREFLDIRDLRDSITNEDDSWQQREKIENQMHDLSLEALQQNVMDTPAPTGVDTAPNMADDIADLMSGVDIHAPLEPLNTDIGNECWSEADIQAAYRDKKRVQEALNFGPGSGKKAFEEVETDKDKKVIKVREDAKGLDPAEDGGVQYLFGTNERVELKNEVEVPMWGGVKKKYPKGTKGYAESLFDRQGDIYLFRTDEGQLIKVKWTDLKAAAK